MIRSMTGFGRAAFAVEGAGFGLEIRTVNHRHLDVSVRVPRLLSRAEPLVRERARQRFSRGKVDVSVSLVSSGAQGVPTHLELDREVAARYVAFAAELGREHDLPGELDVATLVALPGVTRVVEQELDEEALGAALRSALDAALDQVDAMREAEGAALERELRSRLAAVTALLGELEGRADEVVEAAKERLRKRAEQLRQEVGALDASRLHQEVVIAADRLDVREELVRLRSHVEQFGSVLAQGDAGSPVGRRLEFLLQEMGRESNTLGSKGADADAAHRVVDLKTEIERIREQVLNVE